MRSFHQLTQRQRFIIQELLELEQSKSEIARVLGFHRSTICREVKRNSNQKGGYKAVGAHSYRRARFRQRHDYRRKVEGVLEELVKQFLEIGLSPDQISKRLKLEGSEWSVSHETIYRWIYGMSPEYKKCLRWKSRRRQKRVGRCRRGVYRLPRKFIDQRPVEANLRQESGHWERDLLEGRRGGPALLVIQDRHTRLTLIRKTESKHCEVVNRITAEALKGHIVKSITNDNGVEFGKFEELERTTSSPVYYCHPYTSWERGTVENTNGLLRQFYPKHTDFSKVTAEDIEGLEDAINTRPRKTLGYRSPTEVHLGKEEKLIRGNRFYQSSAWKREQEAFKQAMIREVGFYLEKTSRGIVAINH